ncbi:AP2/ERF and B3 domain-containing transcription factor [Tripterygium wilfordii]|uniref:AP2/ERF and B3 domain-containing transcription factor n=1 Tax=Tripterygium wilfordii TaxID=458696 RepID=A0A7J7BVF1_TRIWF|nr:AP2/ERF and B3 domain-containing transcription factor [Tripterygium wilfordii]
MCKASHSQIVQAEVSLNVATACGNGGVLVKQIFRKEIVPSDVGKLNSRLVIPNISQNAEEFMIDGKADDILLVFYDQVDEAMEI